MKLLLASTHLPPETSGAEQITQELARQLSRDHEVHMLTTTKNPVHLKGVTYHILPQKKHPLLYYGIFRKNKLKQIFQEDFDVIHTHMTLPWGYALKNHKAPICLTLHGCEYLHHEHWFTYFAGIAFKNAATLTSPSKWLQKYVKNRYNQSAVVIPNSIDLAFYQKKVAKQKSNVILFSGRMIPLKGIRELLRVARELPEFEFWIVGAGPLAPLAKGKNVRYFGNVSKEEVRKKLQQATLCVFPSYKENFPMVGLEAIASGRATIATPYGFSEIIKHNKSGIIIPKCDPLLIKSAILKIMNDPKLRKAMEKQAVKDAKAFDHKKVVKQYENLYAHIAK